MWLLLYIYFTISVEATNIIDVITIYELQTIMSLNDTFALKVTLTLDLF